MPKTRVSPSLTQSPVDAPEVDSESIAQNSGIGALLRVYWMLLGNLVVSILAGKIYMHAASVFSLGLLDGLFWLMVGLLIGSRYLDFTYFNGLTTDGQPTTASHFRRYTIGVLTLSLVVWLGVHLVRSL
jgi:hypothetical protein